MADYAYINTRIRSMEADLLTEGQLIELISCREPAGAVTYLKKNTYYNVYLQEAANESGTYHTDESIRNSLSDSINRLASIAKGEDRSLIEILLGRWDVFNIKTLIRGKLNNITSFELLQASLPAGTLTEGLLKEIYKQPTVYHIISMLITIGFSYTATLLKIRYMNETDLFKGETALDKAFFAHALNRLGAAENKDINSEIIDKYIRLLIDKHNFVAAVKMSAEGYYADGAADYFIEGGRIISHEVYRKIIKSRGITECISMIESNKWKSHFNRYMSQTQITSPALVAERWMDYEILMNAVSLPREDPLNIGLAVSYICKRINEVINLRTILRGIEYNIPRSEIEELLIITS